MPEASTISVNFGRPMPLFPLSTVVLLPHGVWLWPINMQDPRYTQLVSDALDGAGQIALAVYKPGARSDDAEGGSPALRPAVCVGQIVQHHKFSDGRYALAIQGICRASILHELPSEAGSYRKAMLEPVGLSPQDETELRRYRDQLGALLSESPMTDLREAASVVKHLADDDVPTSAILDLSALAFLPDHSFRYEFLSEGDVRRRAEMVVVELSQTRALLKRASAQRDLSAPKGCCWN